MAGRAFTRGRWWILAVLAGVPAALGVIWLARTAPPTLYCGDVAEPGRQPVVDEWLRGAGPIFAVGALLVLGAIVRISVWRRTDRGQTARPGTPTLIVVGGLALYAIACAIDIDIFVAFALLGILAVVVWFVTLPAALGGTLVWVLTRPAGQRAMGAMQALGWFALIAGVGGVALAVAVPATDPFCFD